MKKLSLQWRITLMTAFLTCMTCIAMNLLLSYSGRHYMDSISSHITNNGDTDKVEPDFFDPEREKLDQELTIIIHGAQESFIATNWCTIWFPPVKRVALICVIYIPPIVMPCVCGISLNSSELRTK